MRYAKYFSRPLAAVALGAPEAAQDRARTYVIAGAVIGAVVGIALGPELYAAEVFPGPIAYGIPVLGGAVAGALIGRLVFGIRRSNGFDRLR